jgi:hypothetical protein
MIVVPTWLIITPAILAFIVYMGLYYVQNPDNRVTDLRFLLGIGCFVVVSLQMFVLIQGYDQAVSSIVLCLAALGLLGVAIWMVFDGPRVVSGKQ